MQSIAKFSENYERQHEIVFANRRILLARRSTSENTKLSRGLMTTKASRRATNSDVRSRDQRLSWHKCTLVTALNSQLGKPQLKATNATRRQTAGGSKGSPFARIRMPTVTELRNSCEILCRELSTAEYEVCACMCVFTFSRPSIRRKLTQSSCT